MPIDVRLWYVNRVDNNNNPFYTKISYNTLTYQIYVPSYGELLNYVYVKRESSFATHMYTDTRIIFCRLTKYPYVFKLYG